MSLVSIVVPVYNNAASLPDLLVRFQTLAKQDSQYKFEFLFVDDGSPDNSLAVLQELQQSEIACAYCQAVAQLWLKRRFAGWTSARRAARQLLPSPLTCKTRLS